MTARELISDLIPPLKTSDTGDLALSWMMEFNVTHLPIVNEQTFLGLITEEDIMDLSDPTRAIGAHKLSLFKPFVQEDVHLFEVVKVANELKLSIIPVVDSEDNYLGVITQENIIKYFGQFSGMNESGGIIVLEVSKRDYSPVEIARIIEQNEATILSLQIAPATDNMMLEVTIKVNTQEIKHIMATFERYEYIVKASYQESDYKDVLHDNYDSLMNFLNI